MQRAFHRGAAATAAVIGAIIVGHPASAMVISNTWSDAASLNLANTSPVASSVGQIYGTDSSGAFAASGVLVASDWVLTAAHVTSGASTLKFYLDSGGTDFGRSTGISADKWVTYSQWTGNLGSGYDLGLVHLGSGGESCGTCIAKLYTGSSELGQTALEVGFGKNGTGSTGATGMDLLKRAGENTVDAFYPTGGKTSRILLADFDSGSASDNSYGSVVPLADESIIAPGDSGGGLFENGYLVGITSFIWARLDGVTDSDYGDVAGWTRVSPFVSWIKSVIGGTTGPGKKVATVSATGFGATQVEVPEPSSLALVGTALAGLGLLGRRRKGGLRDGGPGGATA